jgi:outer membrane protein assembly factor BamB
MKGHVMIRRIGFAGFIAVMGVVLWLSSQVSAWGPLASISPSAWPMFRGNLRHTGQSSVNGPASNNVRWVFTSTNFLSSSPAIASDGTIYIGSWDNNLYAVNPNGTLKWTFPTGSYISSSPAIDSDGIIYIGSWDHNVYAVNPNDGSLKWVYPTNDIVTSSPAIGTDGTVYVGSWDFNVYALTAPTSGVTATLKWKYTTGSYVSSSPAVSGTTVYVGSWDNHLYALTAPASGLTASVVFSYTNGDVNDAVVGSATIGADGTIYFGSYEKKLYALNANGSLKWSYVTDGFIRSSPAIGSDGAIIIGTSWDGITPQIQQDEALYSITWTGGLTGTQRWKKILGCSSDPGGDQMVSTPIVGADGTIYVGAAGATDCAPTGTGSVYALNPDSGVTLWRYTTGNIIQSTPAIGADGTLYVGSYDNGLYAIGTPLNFIYLPLILK